MFRFSLQVWRAFVQDFPGDSTYLLRTKFFHCWESLKAHVASSGGVQWEPEGKFGASLQEGVPTSWGAVDLPFHLASVFAWESISGFPSLLRQRTEGTGRGEEGIESSAPFRVTVCIYLFIDWFFLVVRDSRIHFDKIIQAWNISYSN